ncbi:hypothetical protein Pcinc_032416, partial [Petrolisthes cinctipes]
TPPSSPAPLPTPTVVTHTTWELKVQDAPEAPRDLRVSREGSRDGHCDLAALLHPTHPSPTMSSTSSLRRIRVVAVNSVGESPSSEPLTLRTEGEAPSAAPVKVRAVGRGS